MPLPDSLNDKITFLEFGRRTRFEVRYTKSSRQHVPVTQVCMSMHWQRRTWCYLIN